ncbi:SDR family NAD(P)-dependent oxidoreductase [Rudaeicoccus suwonensis]|uniref:Short-subunit dehydrogenase n=1 Tax=Rudaeicoccus suwonensis TaxID=657409 RepID=A0A561E884_9MICO|nr:SDR family NAD(P)-dependent oxidoreductase [Rudaeicoccus suwonensis]TWE11770.1 short-subunit dehydrogenase [Rudaeicoccus suwonensis]
MPKSIAVVGAGPGLGLAVARRHAREGYTVILIARRQDQLETLRAELADEGAKVHIIAADLSEEGAGVQLAEQIRGAMGTPDIVYYAPGVRGYIPVADLTSADLREVIGVALYALVDLVHEFLPDMISRGHGAILAATAPSAVIGMPQLSATAVLGAQRNYLQALQAAVTDEHVYVGRLYIGATISNSAFHTQQETARAAGQPVIDLPVVDSAELADLLWNMHTNQHTHEVTYPADLFDR